MARASIQTDLSLDTTRFQRGLAKSQKSIKSFVSSGVKQFGALAGATGLGAMAKSAIDLGSKISDMAVQLNIGATELQVLEFAAREAGVEVSVMERALRNVQLRTQEAINGNKSYGKAFERLGIDINEFNKLPTEKKLEAVAVAQKNAKDQTAAYNDVAIILGQRAGPAMQEVLQNLAGPKGYGGLEAAAKRANEVMSDEAIAKMDKAADTIESFKRKLTVLSAEVLSDFTDGLKIMGGWLDKLRGKMEAFDEFEEMAEQSLMARGEFEKFGILDQKIFGFQSQRSKEKQARNMAKLTQRANELREAFKKLSDEEQAVIKGEAFEKTKVSGGIESDRDASDKEALENRIKELKLDQLRIQASGDKSAADALLIRIKLMSRALKLMKEHSISMEEAAKLAAADLATPKKENDKLTEIEKLKEKIKQIEMARIRAEAAGNKEAEASLARRLEMAKEIVRLMELGFSQSEATKMSQGTLAGGGGGTASTGGQSVSDAMSEAKEKGIRFQKMQSVGGERYFQRFVNGSASGKFTADQLKKAAAKRGKSGENEASKQTKFLESIDREIRKNP